MAEWACNTCGFSSALERRTRDEIRRLDREVERLREIEALAREYDAAGLVYCIAPEFDDSRYPETPTTIDCGKCAGCRLAAASKGAEP